MKRIMGTNTRESKNRVRLIDHLPPQMHLVPPARPAPGIIPGGNYARGDRSQLNSEREKPGVSLRHLAFP